MCWWLDLGFQREICSPESDIFEFASFVKCDWHPTVFSNDDRIPRESFVFADAGQELTFHSAELTLRFIDAHLAQNSVGEPGIFQANNSTQ